MAKKSIPTSAELPPENHTFGRARPNASGTFNLHTIPKRDTHFRDLPNPTGNPPFQLDLKSIVPAADYKAIVASKKLVFHLNGDMGGINYDVPQTLVAKGMEGDFDPKAKPGNNPAFLYICGDCVYFNGEIKEYYNQFYRPYEFYPAELAGRR